MSDRNAAVFLDRDGTIIKDKGYIADIRQVFFYNFVFDALRKAQRVFTLFIISNQGGVAKGYLTAQEVEIVNNYIVNILNDNGIYIQSVFWCPHKKEDNCVCRKPNTFFIEQAASRYKIDIARSFVIGDHPSDVMLAKNAGMRGIYVLTGHGRKHRHELEDSVIVKKNLYYAIDYVLRVSQM